MPWLRCIDGFWRGLLAERQGPIGDDVDVDVHGTPYRLVARRDEPGFGTVALLSEQTHEQPVRASDER